MAVAQRTETGAAAGGRRRRGLRRDVGYLGLMFASLGSIIGSGWLFGALYAAQEAGPAALLSWVLGGVGVLLLALIHAELGGMYPVAGGSARFPHFAFGSLAGFAIGWIAWLGAVTTAPIEVEAALQYFTHYASWLTKESGGVVVLTAQGYAVAAALMALFTVVNILGVRKLAQSNNLIMLWKIAIPVLTVIVLMILAFHTKNFSAAGGFNPYGWHGILSAISTGGVIFAYLGFEQAIQLGGESKNPRRDIPLAVITAMVAGVILYVLLQVAFLGALSGGNLSHGWSKLAFNGLVGPFAGLATTVGAAWLATLLYVDAAISPGGTGLLYTGTSARLSYALSRNGYIPVFFGRLNQRGIPIVSTILSFVVGMLIFLPFPGWQDLVGLIVSATVLAYAMAPLALGALRREDAERERPFTLPAAGVLAPAGFVVANLIVFWTGWTTNWKLFVAIAVGFLLLGISHVTNPSGRVPSLDWRAAIWLWPWLGGMALLSYLSTFDGRGTLPFGWDILVVAAFSILIYFLALAVRLPAERVRGYIGDLEREEEEEKRELAGGRADERSAEPA